MVDFQPEISIEMTNKKDLSKFEKSLMHIIMPLLQHGHFAQLPPESTTFIFMLIIISLYNKISKKIIKTLEILMILVIDYYFL